MNAHLVRVLLSLLRIDAGAQQRSLPAVHLLLWSGRQLQLTLVLVHVPTTTVSSHACCISYRATDCNCRIMLYQSVAPRPLGLPFNHRQVSPGSAQYSLNCTKFGQLILRKIIKIVVTRCHIFMPECTKFHFGWGSALHPTGGGLKRSPKPPSWI